MKEENNVTRELKEEVEFDGKTIKKIKFDLEHINRGWDKTTNDYNLTTRSKYNENDIVEIFEQFGFYTIEWNEGLNGNKFKVRNKGKEFYRYIALVTDFKTAEQKKIVIDIPTDFKNEGIILTLY